MKEMKIGSLDCLVKEANVTGGPCVILFHGYGADAGDLAPLSDYLGQSKEVTWIFPQGPLRMVLGPGMTGCAWFPIDEKALEQAMMSGTHRDYSTIRPSGLDEARKKAEVVYEYCKNKYSKVVIGGFSQGAMLTTDLVLTAKDKPEGLIILSGALVDRKSWEGKVQSCKGLSFFQSHGRKDALLSYKGAEALERLLLDAGLDGMLLDFDGGHEIPPQVLVQLKSYLQQVLK